MSEAGIPPGVDSYSTAVAAFLAGSQEQQAVSLFRQMSVEDKAALLAREDRDLSRLAVALGGGSPTLQMSTRPAGPRLGGKLLGQESTSALHDYDQGEAPLATLWGRRMHASKTRITSVAFQLLPCGSFAVTQFTAGGGGNEVVIGCFLTTLRQPRHCLSTCLGTTVMQFLLVVF